MKQGFFYVMWAYKDLRAKETHMISCLREPPPETSSYLTDTLRVFKAIQSLIGKYKCFLLVIFRSLPWKKM